MNTKNPGVVDGAMAQHTPIQTETPRPAPTVGLTWNGTDLIFNGLTIGSIYESERGWRFDLCDEHPSTAWETEDAVRRHVINRARQWLSPASVQGEAVAWRWRVAARHAPITRMPGVWNYGPTPIEGGTPGFYEIEPLYSLPVGGLGSDMPGFTPSAAARQHAPSQSKELPADDPFVIAMSQPLSAKTEADLKAIDDNIRAAHAIARDLRVGSARQHAPDGEAFQKRVSDWMMQCFGADITNSLEERCYRFFEEAGELCQALGMDADKAHALVDYTWEREKGEPSQEVGGVMVTLAAMCFAANLDMDVSGEAELIRISAPEIMDKIRRKHAAKVLRTPHSALPGSDLHSSGNLRPSDPKPLLTPTINSGETDL